MSSDGMVKRRLAKLENEDGLRHQFSEFQKPADFPANTQILARRLMGCKLQVAG
jgi:hypothetical protein